MKFRDNQTRVFIASIAVVGIIIFLNSTGMLKPFKEFSYWLFKYPQTLLSKSGFGLNNVFGSIFEMRDLQKRNSELAEENNRLKKEIVDLNELRYENNQLRNILDLPLVREHKLVDAGVIGKDPYGFLHSLTINRGSDDGINVGMDVIDTNGFFIGEINNVTSSTSHIRMITDSSSNISAIDQESRVQGVVKSDLNSGLIFDMVSQDERVEVGDTIIVSLTGGDTAEGIAKVVSTEKFPNKPFQKIKLAPLADLKNIGKVFVIIK